MASDDRDKIIEAAPGEKANNGERILSRTYETDGKMLKYITTQPANSAEKLPNNEPVDTHRLAPDGTTLKGVTTVTPITGTDSLSYSVYDIVTNGNDRAARLNDAETAKLQKQFDDGRSSGFT